MKIKIITLFLLIMCSLKLGAIEKPLIVSFYQQLKLGNFINAREMFHKNFSRPNAEEWGTIRKIIHQFPTIGIDILEEWDQLSPVALNDIDIKIRSADKYFLTKNYKEAAKIYQDVLIEMNKNKKHAQDNFQLYWSLVHSLARSLYGAKIYGEAQKIYYTLPMSYRFYRQAQFELVWTYYLNERIEFALGAIANISTGLFSQVLEPEAYLLQYYIYRRLCRNEEIEIIKNKLVMFQEQVNQKSIPFDQWIKKDIDSLIYKQVLDSGNDKNAEFASLKNKLENARVKDVERIKKEIEIVLAHMSLASGHKKLKSVKKLLSAEQILEGKNEKWAIDDQEVWADEIGRLVFLQKDLCNLDAN